MFIDAHRWLNRGRGLALFLSYRMEPMFIHNNRAEDVRMPHKTPFKNTDFNITLLFYMKCSILKYPKITLELQGSPSRTKILRYLNITLISLIHLLDGDS